MKVRITELHKDSMFRFTPGVVGKIVELKTDTLPFVNANGYAFIWPKNEPTFEGNSVWCKYEQVEEPDMIHRLIAAEAMRDHYKTLTESWRELATERAKRADKYLETLEMITLLIKGSLD